MVGNARSCRGVGYLKHGRHWVTAMEAVEPRQLMCMDHLSHFVDAPVAMMAERVASAALATTLNASNTVDYTASRRVRLTKDGAYAAVAKAVDSAAALVAADAIADPVTFSTTANGLPILNSRPDGAGLKIFIDWDGASGNGFSDDGFSTDADMTTFNTAEQAVIYSTWRDIVSSFSMLNVNVTTVQPPTGGNYPAFVWQRITNGRAGGAAYVNWIVNYESHGYNNSDNALYRHSGIYHELGHQLGLDHQSAYDDSGNKTAEYITGYDTLHGTIMGIDYSGNIKKWVIGRDTYAADSFQDDVNDMGGTVGWQTSTDGYKPDEYGDTIGTATTLPLINGAYQAAGVIAKLFDADMFRIVSTGQRWNITVSPTFQSPIEPKLDVYDASGNIIASVGDGLYRNAQENASQDLNLNLPAGTYYAKVTGAQNSGDQGEYAFYATPPPTQSWSSVDVNRGNTGRGGYLTYDSSNGTFFQGGSGADVWTNTDSFRFSYQTLVGDGTIIARVDRLDYTATYAKAGVMIRQSLDANAKHVYYGMKPNNEMEAIARSSTGGTAYNNFGGGSTGPWVRLERVGNLFTISRSANGVSWTVAGTTTVAMTGPVMIGLATCANNFSAQTTSSFSNVTVAATGSGQLGDVLPTYNGLSAPANLSAAPVAAQTTGIALSWIDVLGETGYRIERSIDNRTFSSIGTVGADVTTFTDGASGWGTMRYWYRVTALTSGGNSEYADAVSSLNKPGAPGLLQAIKLSPTRVSLSWRDVNGDAGYRVERSTNGGASYATLSTTPQNVALFNDNSAQPGVNTYRITPLSGVGNGVPLVFNVTMPLGAVSNLRFTTKSSTSMTIAWDAVATATGYRVERSADGASSTLR